METTTENVFVHNLDTDKLELHFASKSDYTALSEEIKDKIRRYYNWSRRHGKCWVSKKKGPAFGYAQTIAELAGLDDGGTVGTRPDFADEVARKQRRAEQKADRYEGYAESASESGERLIQRGHEMFDRIPFGQPLMPGHHSYEWDKRYRERAHNKIRRGMSEKERARYWKRRAQAAQRTAEGKKYSNPRFLHRRIEEAKAEIRKLERGLKDPWDEAHAEKLRGLLEREQDKLAFYEACMEEVGGLPWTRERLKEMGATHVKVIGQWYPIERINKKSVTVNHWLGYEGSTYRVSWDKVQDARRIEEKETEAA